MCRLADHISVRVTVSLAVVFLLLASSCAKPEVPPAGLAGQPEPPSQTLPPAKADPTPPVDETDPLSRVKAAVSRYMATDHKAFEILRCEKVNKDYYLAELKLGNEFFYLYADKEGKEARPAIGLANRPIFSKCEAGEAWFECNQMADNYTVFPYYEVTQPDPFQYWDLPLFKAIAGDSYEVGAPGLAYAVRDVGVSSAGVFMQVDVTGPSKSGVMAGGARPPKTFITESEQSVTFRFQEISLDEPLRERLLSYESPYAKIIGVETQGDFTDVVVKVTGDYSFYIMRTIPGKAVSEPSAPYGSLALGILFRPSPKDNSFDARQVTPGHEVAGMQVSDIIDLRERVIGGQSTYSVEVRFSGQVTLTGTYFHNPTSSGDSPELYDCWFSFEPDSESAKLLPRLGDDNRFAWFLLTNHDEAEAWLGPPGSTGKATIVISDYAIIRRFSDEGNCARLVQVVTK